MSDIVLAQLNLAKMRYPIDAAEMTDFVDNIDRINQLAEQSPGFVWRFTGDTDLEAAVFDTDILVNFSTWTDVESLHHYVFKTAHTEIMRRRKEWFDRMEINSVLWWHHNDATPTLPEAGRRLTLLQTNGPNEESFTFKHRYHKPET